MLVLIRPDARPESSSVAPDMASVMSAGNDSPAPVPISSMLGNTSTQ
jgi:hypothetical protein